MLNVNGHTYNIDAYACLEAYFLENEGWHDIMASPRFTHEERRTFFGPDCNRRNMREVRMSPEWVAIVTQFATENGLNVHEAIRKATFTPRGAGQKVRQATPPAQQQIGNPEVQRICTNAAKAESDAKEIAIALADKVTELSTALTDLSGTVTVLSGTILAQNELIAELETEIKALRCGKVKHTITLEMPDTE